MPVSKCMNCKEERSMAFEAVERAEKHAKSWRTAWLITFIMLLLLIGSILYYVMTSDIEVVTQDGYGVNNYIGNDGDVYNGTTSDFIETEKSEQS